MLEPSLKFCLLPDRRKKGEEGPDPEQIAKDIERLRLIREKR